MKIYMVGGAVRDDLLGRPSRERDFVVVGATPTDLLAEGFLQVGKDFPVFLHPQTKEEYALARGERRGVPGSRTRFHNARPDITLEQDLARRDLTINAMARDDQGRLIDPYRGQSDLANRVLRHVSRAFAEDPIRILRVARFAARFADLRFRVAEETISLMREMVAQGDADRLVPERVWQELVRALQETRPSAFFDVLRRCGALPRLFPEFVSDESGLRALREAVRLSPAPEVRFAALVSVRDGEIDDRKARLEAIENLCRRLRAPRRFHDLALLVAAHQEQAARVEVLSGEEILTLLEQTDAMRRPDRFNHFLQACQAVLRSKPSCSHDATAATICLKAALRAVTACDTAKLVADDRDPESVKERIRRCRIGVIEDLRAADRAAGTDPLARS